MKMRVRSTRLFWTLLASILAASPVSAAEDWAPCGGAGDSLWSWAWAGNAGEHVTTRQDAGKPVVIELADLSGNGHHYFNRSGGSEPGYQVGLSVGGYSTDLPVIAVDFYRDGAQRYTQWLEQNDSLTANSFYLAFAGMNTRINGERELWGTTLDHNVRVDQAEGEDRLYIVINGRQYMLGGRGAIPKGPVLIEIWRDEENKLHLWANGQDVSQPGIVVADTFILNGVGGGEVSGYGAWDDYAFEYVVCSSVPTELQRSQAREYLREKWSIYAASETARPLPPSNLTSE